MNSEHEAALAEYRRHQDAEGATLADESAIARAQGQAWVRYLAACERDGVKPESLDVDGA
jgi:hypothetical protein